ncbi:MAG TPA: hypothetical protein PKW66_19220 [Polyangiaceae bacterium]|nr:hypothetical protein [Polyangiaceae bacterium]
MKLTQEQAFGLLAARLEYARREHPMFAEYTHDAVDVIRDEWRELHNAVHMGEGPARVLDEALDVAATAMRLVIGEVQG